jgi:hypothetical protein
MVSIPLGFLALRLMRFRVGPPILVERIERLESEIDAARLEKDRLRSELNHAEKDADAAKNLIGELSGRRDSQARTIADLSAACERLKEDLTETEHQKAQLYERFRRARRRALRLSAKLQSVEVSSGRVWEVPVPSDVIPFRFGLSVSAELPSYRS